MKWIFILILSFFLFSFLNCKTTKQETAETVEPTQETEKTEKAVSGTFDLSGAWVMTNDWSISGCDPTEWEGSYRNRSKDLKEKMTVEISQKGNTIKLVQVKPKRIFDGIINNNNISLKGKIFIASGVAGGTFGYRDYTLAIDQNANTLSGKTNWFWWGDKAHFYCDGIFNLTLKRTIIE